MTVHDFNASLCPYILINGINSFNSDMQEDLAAIQNNPARAIYCSQRLLCRTLAGNNVYILTITSPGTTVSP